MRDNRLGLKPKLAPKLPTEGHAARRRRTDGSKHDRRGGVTPEGGSNDQASFRRSRLKCSYPGVHQRRRPERTAGPDAPAGLCRVWIDGVPPGRQARATDCVTARRTAPAHSHVLYGGDLHRIGTANGTVNGQYDARRDPRSPSYDARYDPNSGQYDPRYGQNRTTGTYEPRYGTNGANNGTVNDPRYGRNGTTTTNGTYDPRYSTTSNGRYDSRMSQKEREKWEKKREKEHDKAERKNHKDHDGDRDR